LWLKFFRNCNCHSGSRKPKCKILSWVKRNAQKGTVLTISETNKRKTINFIFFAKNQYNNKNHFFTENKRIFTQSFFIFVKSAFSVIQKKSITCNFE
ncbi:hypothetical protein, partial [Flavobacterium limnosediminis]|uniref:hypothetical protein n=1 Tax=Flavobacterium limnosediminis TaxID=1401027 RepID=UPI000558F316